MDLDNALSWTMAEAQRRKEISLALTRQLMLQKAKGELIKMSSIQPAWGRVVSGTRNAMLQVPSTIRLRLPHIAANDVETIREIIRDALRAASLRIDLAMTLEARAGSGGVGEGAWRTD